MTNITFKKAVASDKLLIKQWWNKPHVVEFWDNSPECWKNAEDYLDQGIKDLFDYYIGSYDSDPFALVMMCNENKAETHPEHLPKYLTKPGEGETATFDFMIGNEKYLGKGLSYLTLKAFINFCPPEIKRFLIDPASDNTLAIHVYEKAGFREIDRYTPKEGNFVGKEHIMMRYDR